MNERLTLDIQWRVVGWVESVMKVFELTAVDSIEDPC